MGDNGPAQHNFNSSQMRDLDIENDETFFDVDGYPGNFGSNTKDRQQRRRV